MYKVQIKVYSVHSVLRCQMYSIILNIMLYKILCSKSVLYYKFLKNSYLYSFTLWICVLNTALYSRKKLVLSGNIFSSIYRGIYEKGSGYVVSAVTLYTLSIYSFAQNSWDDISRSLFVNSPVSFTPTVQHLHNWVA